MVKKSFADCASESKKPAPMAKYIFDDGVERELAGRWNYIAQDNPEAATRVIEAAYKTFELLAVNPEIGIRRRFRNLLLVGIRSFKVIGFSNYIVFYRPVQDGIQ